MGQILSGSIKCWRTYRSPQTDGKWVEAYNSEESYDIMSGAKSVYLGNQASSDTHWSLYRVIGYFSIPSELPSLMYALIKSVGYMCLEFPTHGYIYDATGLDLYSKATYSAMINLPPEKLLGTYEIPYGVTETEIWIATFNSTGLAFLESKKGTNAYIALWSDEQPPFPGNSPLLGYYRDGTHSKPSTLCYNEVPGYIWVEGIYLAFLDVNRRKNLVEGSLTGTTGKIAGHTFVEGNYLHYIDDTGAERRILGILTGLTGKIPGQISINMSYPLYGRNLCYIDSSGNERGFWQPL